ncbi:MAG: serine/threonine protein kinase [Labilithrix sp.]|nr:serine/threonine protein kinase [Labilithrix sp.]MCW5813305.1 serine/threonine protein kinase [Labilithrix sp.]
MAWRDRPATFAAATLGAAFDAARGRAAAAADRAAAASVVAALLPHVEPTERTIAESVETLLACVDDPAAIEVVAAALPARARDDHRIAAALARVARRAHERGAARSVLVLLDLLLATPESAALVDEAWAAAAFAALAPAEVGSSPRVARVRRLWAEHKKTRPSWLGDVDDEKTDLFLPSFSRARHAELVAVGAMPPPVARSAGRYRLLEEIGAGGMGTVHLARLAGSCGFERWAAIKQLHPYFQEDDDFVRMFLDEARLTAAIVHPNVASILELGREDDGYWIAMEYLHGEPLSAWLRSVRVSGRPVPPEIACRIVADAAAGLHAAHELASPDGAPLELVHRDVTPHNVFVTFDGATKVVDFGLAKLSAVEGTRCAGRSVAGKLPYMSPEQVRGERVDRRADVFGLGVILWELTTTRRLFRRETDLDTLSQVLECTPPRPSTVVAGYPGDLEGVVMKALAKDPAARYATARELSRALSSVLHRRSLLVGAEEVAAYARSLLADQVRARDACLARHRGSMT